MAPFIAVLFVASWGRSKHRAAIEDADTAVALSRLSGEVRALTSLVLSQSERISSLEAQLRDGVAVGPSVVRGGLAEDATPAPQSVASSATPLPSPSPTQPRKAAETVPPSVPPLPPSPLPSPSTPPPTLSTPPAVPRKSLATAQPVTPPMPSPHLRLHAAITLEASLAAVALAPSAVDAPARTVLLADGLGRVHALDAFGRALMPPALLVQGASGAAPQPILSLVFLGSAAAAPSPPPRGGGAAATPVVFAAAMVAAEPQVEGFAFALARLAPVAQPTPEQRVRAEVLKLVDVVWPTVPTAGAPPEGGGAAAAAATDAAVGGAGGEAGGDGAGVGSTTGAESGAHDAAGEGGGAVVAGSALEGDPSSRPRLVALEAMSAPGGGGGGGGRGRAPKGKPDFLAVRSDGLLVTLTAAGDVITGVHSGVQGITHARRSGNTLALLSRTQLVLIELARRAPPRRCAIPDSVKSTGATLSGVSFDAHVGQLLYVATSDGDVLVFNSRASPAAAAAGGGSAAGGAAAGGGAAALECRWYESVAVEHGGVREASASLGAVRGYLLSAGEAGLAVRNVSTFYRSNQPSPAELVHYEPMAPRAVADAAAAALVADGRRRDAHGDWAVRPRMLLASGTTVVVEGSGAVHLYSSSLPYEVPVPPTWPQYAMGAAVIGITVVWQLFKRRGKSAKEADDPAYGKRRGGRGGGRGGGRNGRGRRDEDDFADMRDVRGGRGAMNSGAAAHYAAHMGAYGDRGGGGNRGSGAGGIRGGFMGGDYGDDSDDY